MVAVHICHNTMCISPSHLVWGILEENRDGRKAAAHAVDMLTKQLRTVI